MGIDLGRFKSKSNEGWVDWLADDPVPASIRNRMRAQAVREASRPIVRRVGQPRQPATPQQAKKQSADGHSVSIHISVPKFKKPDFSKLKSKLPEKLPKGITYKQVGIGGVALVTVLVIGVVALQIHGKKTGKSSDSKGVLSAADQKPSFQTLSPTGNSGGKASEMRYNPEHKIVTFVDSIGGVDINVTEQALPDDFKDNTDDKVKKLAEGFTANEVLSTSNPTAYIGTSIQGPQSVIFHKNGLLVFIKSTKKIDNHDWAEYITSLQ